MLLTKFTDPFGGFAMIPYDAAGRIQSITDAVGMASSFTYGSSDFIAAMTTPYGTTTFRHEALFGNPSIEATDPVGGRERVEFDFVNNALPTAETSSLVPTGFSASKVDLHKYNSLYWDKVAMARYPMDVTKAVITSWMFYADPAEHHALSHNVPHSIKRPLENRVWFRTLDALIDAKGQRTTWERDVEGRVTREVRADGTTDTTYVYDAAGRLSTVTDPMDQVTTYSYNVDDSLASTGFTNETIATPDVSHTYDTYYPRPLTMVDGNGTTTYAYVAPGTNGGGQLASVDGPFSSDTMVYTYDAIGRVLSRKLNSTGTALTYDALGRISQLTFPIGAFDYTYVGTTGRRSTVTYPNSQTTTYSYLDDEHDFRLQTIHHKNPSAATLSKFDYTYDTVGNIQTLRQERAGAATQIYAFTNDLVDQLASAVLTDTNTTPTILKRQAWAYDAAGNRNVDQTDDDVFATSHDSMNRLQSRAPGGPVVFEGSLNEPGTVTIDGKPAEVDASNNFQGTASLTGATTTVTVKAKDASGNETTKQYEVDSSGSTTTSAYDANGSMTSDGTRTYFWNALSQLVEVKQGTTTTATFEYDGAGRRTEKIAAGDTHVYVYDAEDIIEERIAGSTSDTLRFYHGVGIDEPLARKNSSDVVGYYLVDHLGSVVQETLSSGAVSLEREYDAWGAAVSGGSSSGYGFTGREWDAEVGLYYYRARYYSPTSGRFISDDPMAFRADTNFSAYVSAQPTRLVDPTGLQATLNCRVPTELLRKFNSVTGLGPTDDRGLHAQIASQLVPFVSMTTVPAGAVAGNLARFVGSLPKGATDVRVYQSGENYLFAADVPGRTPGWSAVYQKLVNTVGETIGYIKSTLDASGNPIVGGIKQKFP